MPSILTSITIVHAFGKPNVIAKFTEKKTIRLSLMIMLCFISHFQEAFKLQLGTLLDM